ncbi:MAG: hypothetical protein H6581_14980 [Bacteroidia bacterium]|nr:hypothetical protein [Bacteroidia bacterium]
MKFTKYLLAFLIIGLFIQSKASAQTLTFSQVLLISSVQDTVPPGKVWKISGMVADFPYNTTTASNCTTAGYAKSAININGNQYYLSGSGIASGTASGLFTLPDGPVWLPAGTRFSTVCPGSLVSILEFTITP